MVAVVVIISLMITGAGCVLIIKPELIIEFLRNNAENPALWIFAIVMRLLLGVALIFAADHSRWPTLIIVLGYISIIAAAFIAVLNRRSFARFMAWVLSWIAPAARVGGLVVVVFGGLLIYALM